MKNIFPEKSYTKFSKYTDPIVKNKKLAYLLIDSLKDCKFVFILCPSRGPPKCIKT